MLTPRDNATYGLLLDNSGSPTAGVTFTAPSNGENYFNGNGTANLRILTNGKLSMTNVNSNVSPKAIDVPLTVGDVSLTNITFSNTSGGDAAAFNSNGVVTATNVNTSIVIRQRLDDR